MDPVVTSTAELGEEGSAKLRGPVRGVPDVVQDQEHRLLLGRRLELAEGEQLVRPGGLRQGAVCKLPVDAACGAAVFGSWPMLAQQILRNALRTLSSRTKAAASIVLPTPPMPLAVVMLLVTGPCFDVRLDGSVIDVVSAEMSSGLCTAASGSMGTSSGTAARLMEFDAARTNDGSAAAAGSADDCGCSES